jgi:two-component sensor histidine kinase
MASKHHSDLEERLQLALDASDMGTWSSVLATGEQVWDRRQYQLFGLPEGTPVTRDLFLGMVLSEDLPLVDYKSGDLTPGARHFCQFRIRRADGAVRWITAHSVTKADGNRAPVELVGVNWDVTDQKDSESRLVEAERRLALATEAAGTGIWDWNVETGQFYYSPIARDIYGFTADEQITFEKLKERTHPKDYLKIEPILGRALDPFQRGRESYRYRITRADSREERWLLAHGSAAFVHNRPIRYTGTLQDITDEVVAKVRLEDEQARLQLALSAADLAVWELNVVTNEITASPELNRLYRFPEDARPSVGEFQALYAPGERERVESESVEALKSGNRTIRFEAKHQWPDGVEKWISVRAQIILDEQGAPVRVIGVAMDVTERRRYEDHLRLTARELQHRVKNSLAVVQSIAVQSFRGLRSKEEGIAVFTGRLHALASATDLLTKGNWEAVPVGEIVEEIVTPFNDQIQITARGSELRIPSGVAVNLGMALHELSTNAVKYGALSVASGRVAISWVLSPDGMILDWQESGGPPVSAPAKTGFGTSLLSRGLFADGTGKVELSFNPGGVSCRITVRSVSGPSAM